ncbi:MAG TPA: hypothetical protein VKX17_06525 [Planctomycetota bacterium]|nr:hypothetical protein [Planctomycetota bacterium]
MRVRLVLLFLILAAVAVALFHYVQPAASASSAAVEEARARILNLRGDWVRVKRGDFEIAIQEDGELRPVKVTSLTFLVPGKVGFIAPEGSYVSKGDRVIALETKDLEDEITHIQEDLGAADAALAQQEQFRELEIKRLATELKSEQENAAFAALKERELLAHPNSVEREEAKNTIESAAANLTFAAAEESVMKPLLDQGFCSKQDYELKVVAVDKAKIETTRADMKARIINYGPLDDDRMGAKYDTEYGDLTFKLKEIDNHDQLTKLDLTVKGAERLVHSLKHKLDRRKLELERSTLHAPHDGVVVYRTMGYRNNKKPEVGERVSPWIAPIDLPNYEKMKVRTQAPESLIRKINARIPAPAEGGEAVRGSPVKVTINTLPGIVYTAQVTWIDGWARDRNSKLSDADIKAQGLSGVKVFDVEVELDMSDPKHLREGFRARVDFPDEALKNVIAVPEQAVSTIDGVSTVMVLENGSPVARKIELGRAGQGKVVILSGLNEKEQIWVPKIAEPKAPEDGAAKKKDEPKSNSSRPSGGPPSLNSNQAPEPVRDKPYDRSGDRRNSDRTTPGDRGNDRTKPSDRLDRISPRERDRSSSSERPAPQPVPKETL